MKRYQKILAFLLVLTMLIGMTPMTVFAKEEAESVCEHTHENGICMGCGEKNPNLDDYEGKTISILGDSISTYAGISDDSTVNVTLSGSTIYYGQGALGGYRHTWWQQIIDALGMELLVNNSWSGTCVLKTRGTVGAYIDRCVQLHNDRTGEQPDVIAVFLGTNDYSYYQSTLGTAEIDYAALITDRGDGTFDYAKPTTTCEAYAIMLHKMTQRYPDAEIYCLGMLSRRDPDHDGREVVPPPTSFNAELKAIVERFGGTYVDVESCIPATASEFDRYMSDRRVHPNAAGMDKITEAVVGTMLQRQITLRNVSYDLHNVSCSKEPAAVIENERLELTLSATDKDLDLAVRITMVGEDITSQCYANGKVSIAKITGDIVITAMVLHRPSDYQWQFDNGELVSAGTNANQLTKLAGSTQDNVFRETRYQLAVTAELIHTRPWVVEWAGEGKGGFMLSQTSNSTGAPFFFRRSGNYLTAFGHYNNNRYDNYGLTLDAANINGAAKHVYRLENRIAQNGNNMVWLLVDGIEIGALNNYYIAGASQGSTADWISGKDFYINYIGSSSHPLTGYALEYLFITECAHIFSNGICTGCGEEKTHIHSYESVITPSTCTEQGYTTYTCTICGDSYVDDYVDARGYEWMLEDGEFKILLIGNSFSKDASNVEMPNSQMLDILQAMLGDHVSVTVGVCFSGGKGLNWHATQSEQGNKKYSLWVINSENGTWESCGSSTSANALAWTDWDVVSLQHYGIDTTTGKETNSYPDQVDPKFDNLKSATEFMLDYVDQYAPNAAVSFYMHWARASKSMINESLDTYNKMAAFLPEVMNYAGNNSANRFDTIIPVGLSIQNARTTYLSLLKYNSDTDELTLETDPQKGLQRDGGHLSYNIGRYIAALTFAETLIPDELRAEGYVLPDIRITESVGKLPKEYSIIAQKSVHAAVESWRNGSLAVTNIEGYTEDPAITAAKTIDFEEFSLDCSKSESLDKKIENVVLSVLPVDFAVDEVVIDVDASTATVIIRFGYTSQTVTVTYSVESHSYTPTVKAPTCTEQGYTTYTCTICGDSYVDDYVDAMGHSFTNYVSDKNATIFADGTKTAKCDRCDAMDTVVDEGSKLKYIPGDMNGDETLNSADAIYLLRHMIMPNLYPIAQSGDVNGDGVVNSADAIYLLRHVIMPELYPIR